MNEVLSVLHTFATSPVGIALQAALGWIVLDAMLTAALELKLGRFAPEAFSYFLEKAGGEYLGLVVLGIAATVTPLMIPFFMAAIAAFTVTESNGAYLKISAFIESLKAPK